MPLRIKISPVYINNGNEEIASDVEFGECKAVEVFKTAYIRLFILKNEGVCIK